MNVSNDNVSLIASGTAVLLALSQKSHRSDLFTLVIHRTVLHDLSLLAICRTMQINSRPTEIIFLEAKWQFACVTSLISMNQATYES